MSDNDPETEWTVWRGRGGAWASGYTGTLTGCLLHLSVKATNLLFSTVTYLEISYQGRVVKLTPCAPHRDARKVIRQHSSAQVACRGLAETLGLSVPVWGSARPDEDGASVIIDFSNARQEPGQGEESE